jgi:hypothetical protein
MHRLNLDWCLNSVKPLPAGAASSVSGFFIFDRVIGRSIKLEVASTERIAGIRDEQLFHD